MKYYMHLCTMYRVYRFYARTFYQLGRGQFLPIMMSVVGALIPDRPRKQEAEEGDCDDLHQRAYRIERAV